MVAGGFSKLSLVRKESTLKLRIAPTISLMLLSMMLIASCLQVSVAAQSQLDQIVILYDASHDPQFSATDSEKGLKLMLDMVNASTHYIVKVFNGPRLNDTVLENVDVLIIASPDSSKPFHPTEIRSINEYLLNGSSMLVLGDPCIAQTLSNYWSEPTMQDLGDNIALNNFLDALNITGIRFSINATGSDYWADTMFDYARALNETRPHVFGLDSNAWDISHPIFRDINELVLMTATLKPLRSAGVVATGVASSFAQFRKGPNTFANYSFPNMTLEEFAKKPLSYSAINGTFPPWLAAFEINGSRVVIGGSTIMFTGWAFDLPTTDARSSQRWFYAADNSRLFMNIIRWLSERYIQSPSAIAPVLITSSVIFLMGMAYYILKRPQ